MKRFCLIILTSVLCTFNFCYSLTPLTTLLNNSRSDELGKRYIKLGLSWIVAGDLEKAENYLTYGIKIVKITGNKYWTAVGYEYSGYLYLAKNDNDEALEYFTMAQKLYNKYGKLENGEGSNVSLATLIAAIKNGDATIFEGGNNPSMKPTSLNPSTGQRKSPNTGEQQILSQLLKKLDNLEKENIIIQSKLDNLVPSSPSLAIPGN